MSETCMAHSQHLVIFRHFYKNSRMFYGPLLKSLSREDTKKEIKKNFVLDQKKWSENRSSRFKPKFDGYVVTLILKSCNPLLVGHKVVTMVYKGLVYYTQRIAVSP